MLTRKQVEDDIRKYCELNGITDIESFMTSCLMKGLAVFKFGTSPADNVRRQNGTAQEEKVEPVVVKKKRVSVRKTTKTSDKAD